MTIQSSDIRLLESERMTDATDGGGRRTNRVIPDGVVGNIFPKVSRVDSVYGRVNLRKIYPHINTANLDVYAGANFIIADAPENDRISVLAFSTGSDFDLRSAARDRIESYVIAGPESRMTLYGRQLNNAGAILVYQRPEEPLPEIGDVFAISAEVGGVTTAQQFVRVQDVTHEVRTFTEDQVGGEFQRRVITLKIGAPLRHEFNGVASPSRYGSVAAQAPGRLRATTVADAARYFGIQPLTAAVSSGALELKVASVYASIVPTTQRETPLSLSSMSGAVFGLDCANTTITEPVFNRPAGNANFVYRTARAIKPGTLVISDGYTSVDNGHGVITSNVGNNGYSGTVDYESGVLNLTAINYGNYPSMTIRYTPQAYVSQTAHTHAIAVTLATRGTVYAVPLLPLPAPGTLIVDFRSLGKWYRLRDNGAGELVGGDTEYGTGTVDYVTGAATITLGALPDVGSSVLLSWGSPVHYEILAASPASGFEIVLSQAPVKPGTVVLTWMDSGTPKTASDNGSGLITGHATGTIVYQTGEIVLRMAAPIAADISIAYDRDTPPVTQASHDFGGPVVPFSVGINGVNLTLPNGVPYTGLSLRDNGAGQLRLMGFDGYIVLAQYWVSRSQSFGSVDYATGVITMAASVSVTAPGTWNEIDKSWVLPSAGSASVSAAGAQFLALPTGTAPDVVAQTQTATVGSLGTGLSLKLSEQMPVSIVPGSLMFTAFGKRHIDRNGTVYTDLSYSTGSGRAVGTIDYATGNISLTDYPGATAANLVINTALGRKGDYTATSVSFRTAGSPLRPASLYVQCTAADGELLSGTADQSGHISGGMSGVVEQTMGVASVEFAKPVLPGTLRYSAVVLSNLPLNADQLGLDPVRLPSDGRVPIFRPADVVVVHHTDSYNAGTPTAGSTINVGRTELSALWLEDAYKKKLSAALYTTGLDAGTVTMAADLSLTGYVPPITARHRIEEMGLLSDVQINGQITLSAPLLRSFPAGSMLSSALLYGDLQARVTNLFDQQTWTGVWQSTVIGNGAPVQYNDVDSPVEVLNSAAVTERWRINFTSSTGFQVIGENLGLIATGTTDADLQVTNALTGAAYFTLRKAGWGGGWAAGNQLRFDTIAAAPPTWLVRCVLPGAAITGDRFGAQLRGDAD